MSNASTTRFSDRVDAYQKYRPTYPQTVLDFFKNDLELNPSHVIADVGSGTGILTDLLLSLGNRVIGVEPNDEMRGFAEKWLGKNPDFISVKATGEATTLPDHTVDWITVAQAFHWMEPKKTQQEFRRILKNPGTVVLLWNDRRTEGDEFHNLYEKFLLEFATDYTKVNHKNTQKKEIFDIFFAPHRYEEKSFLNTQRLDYEGLMGRVISSSYMPNKGDSIYPKMDEALRNLFERFQNNGKIDLLYDTKLYFSRWT